MIDVKPLVVSTLEGLGIPVSYELFVHEGIPIPSISYLEITNTDLYVTDAIEYDTIVYQVKLWSDSIQYISEKTILISNEMRDLGFRREFAQELTQNGLIQKVMRFRAITTNKV